MGGHIRRRPIVRLALAVSLAIAALGGAAASPDATTSALSRWTGGIDLYRSGVFTTQKTWLWCTAADIQIIRNIVQHKTDHSKASQQRYFDYMRGHNRYDIPVKDGVDPAGWTAGLRHYVDSRYKLYASKSFDSALRSAVTNLRKTNLPVGITVGHGNHAWVLTGFTATADPARTSDFKVTSVRVVGPLWGLQSRTSGYDMVPDKKLTISQFKSYFTPWHYAGVKMAWEGRWVSVQPVAAAGGGSKPAKTPAPTPSPTPVPTPTPTLAPPLAAVQGLAPSAEPTAAPIARVADPMNEASAPSASPAGESAGLIGALAIVIAASLIAIGAAAVRARRPTSRTPDALPR